MPPATTAAPHVAAASEGKWSPLCAAVVDEMCRRGEASASRGAVNSKWVGSAVVDNLGLQRPTKLSAATN